MFKFRNDMLPNMFNEMFHYNVNVYQYQTHQRNKLYVSKRRISIALKHISYRYISCNETLDVCPNKT